jgi:hypothetical protein
MRGWSARAQTRRCRARAAAAVGRGVAAALLLLLLLLLEWAAASALRCTLRSAACWRSAFPMCSRVLQSAQALPVLQWAVAVLQWAQPA